MVQQRWCWHPMNRAGRSKRRLTATCAAFWGLSVAFSPSEPMADNINVPERNTLPVLYNINVSTVILSPRQHYISIYISVTWSHTTSAKWKQAAPKNHLCNEPQIAGNEVCLEWVVIVWTMWFSIDCSLSFYNKYWYWVCSTYIRELLKHAIYQQDTVEWRNA